MLSVDEQVHIFARPERRAALTECLQDVIGCGPPDSLDMPGGPESILIFHFPDGGVVSIEFVENADDSEGPRLGAWLQFRVNQGAQIRNRVRTAGYQFLDHPGQNFFFVAPGGQVLSIIDV